MTRTALPLDAWDAETRRVQARIEDYHASITDEDYARLLHDLNTQPTQGEHK